MKGHKRVFLVLSCCILFTSKVSAVVLPTVIINPWNPLFSCDVPTINVRVNDFINFACPDLTRNFYIKDFNDKTTLYENLFYLGDDEHAFSTCNATGARRLLRCSNSSVQPFDLAIRDASYFPDQIAMKKGKSYYFIDTAYRAVQTLDNLIGGSCNKSENGQFKIRFKLYICTDEEVNNGQCEQCISEGCYYRDCGKTCAEWATISESIKENTRLQGRQCTNILLGTTTTEYQTVPSLPSNCTVWTVVSVQQVETNCSYVKKRTCTNSLGSTHVELEERSEKLLSQSSYCEKTCEEWATISESIKENTRLQGRQCTNILLGTTTTEYQTVPSLPSNCTVWTVVSVQQVGTNCSYVKKRTCTNSVGNTHVELEEKFDKCQPQPTGSSQVESKVVESNNIQYVAIGASLGCFLLGAAIGYLCHRHKHSRTIKSVSHSKDINLNGYLEDNHPGVKNHAFEHHSGSFDVYDGKHVSLKQFKGGEIHLS